MIERKSSWRCHGGDQRVYTHASSSTKTQMAFSVFVPKGEGPFPVLWFLSGLTCTWENVTTKGHFQQAAAECGVMVVCPDTSPRGPEVADDSEYDLGQGAGFYVDATEDPWRPHFQMYRYIAEELPALVFANLPGDSARQSICGHSMGGHGALTLALKNPQRFRCVSAFAPIGAPSQVPWGQKALTAYLGDDRAKWRAHDAVSLLEDGCKTGDILVDQGSADAFLTEQLRPEKLQEACDKAGQKLTLRMQEGYDHSYYFISTFLGEHIHWHKERL